jgi:hypothetical protein
LQEIFFLKEKPYPREETFRPLRDNVPSSVLVFLGVIGGRGDGMQAEASGTFKLLLYNTSKVNVLAFSDLDSWKIAYAAIVIGWACIEEPLPSHLGA